MGEDNNSRPENNMYILCTLSGMFKEIVEKGKRYNQYCNNTYS